MGGDFNKILSRTEKIGGPPRQQWQMDNYREAIDCCGLDDLLFVGHGFTWSNGKGGDHNIQCCLDYFFALTRWMERWQSAKVYNLVPSHSDHLPIFLDTCIVSEDSSHSKKEKPFYFEKM